MTRARFMTTGRVRYTVGMLAGVARTRGWANVRESEWFAVVTYAALAAVVGALFILAAVVLVAIPALLVYVVLLSTFAGIARSIFHNSHNDV